MIGKLLNNLKKLCINLHSFFNGVIDLYINILETIGNTPIVKLKSNLFAKLEYFNPFGSIKDRAAFQMLKDAKKEGFIEKGATVVEATSGNMGISIAAIGNVMGYKTIIVMPENMSLRRKELLNEFGAELVLTDAEKGMMGAVERANKIKNEIQGSYMPNQFENYSGVWAHYLTTAPEIDRQMDGKVDVVVCGIGTGATITGIANYFYGKNVKVIGVEPEKSPFLSEGYSGIHNIQGIGAGFRPQILNLDLIDEIVTVSDEEALFCAKSLMNSDGLFGGISSGAVYSAALKISQREEFIDKNIVVIFADSWDRYL